MVLKKDDNMYNDKKYKEKMNEENRNNLLSFFMPFERRKKL
jgi:hypothetical protein